jgi:signal transduction histidine kinase
VTSTEAAAESASDPGGAGARRRTVAARILASYAVILLVFVVAAGWSLWAQRSSAREAELLRSGYLPLSLSLRDLVANQDTWNTQLNHVTTALNPADKRIWFETALGVGRPKRIDETRARIHAAFERGDRHTAAIGAELLAETSRIERFLREDDRLVAELFDALAQGQNARAETLRDELVTRGSRAKRNLSSLERRVQHHVDVLLDQARERERMALGVLVALAVLTLLVGLLMLLYARRVLRPLRAVTERAQAVARGDLSSREPLGSRDELGELSVTFESMVTAIGRANEQLRAGERLATIGKMAAHVTHEIRNPLSSIALNLELLEEEIPSHEAESRSLVRAISREVERLSALSGQYLSMAKSQPPRLEAESLGELVEEACEFMRADLARHGVTLELEVPDEALTARVDEAQIKQALFNLVRNAREAMQGGGVVRVSVSSAPEVVRVVVEDQGPGIDPDVAERLFDPFFTTKGHGTGLGLSVTRQIVAAHGGTIRHEARPGGGSRFVLSLPTAPRDEADAARASGSAVLDTPPADSAAERHGGGLG